MEKLLVDEQSHANLTHKSVSMWLLARLTSREFGDPIEMLGEKKILRSPGIKELFCSTECYLESASHAENQSSDPWILSNISMLFASH